MTVETGRRLRGGTTCGNSLRRETGDQEELDAGAKAGRKPAFGEPDSVKTFRWNIFACKNFCQSSSILNEIAN
jgi:hypothetical protein